MTRPQRKVSIFFKSVSAIQSLVLTVFFVIPPNVVQAQTFNVLNLPAPGSLVNVSENFVPVLLKGISLHPENPLVFDFIVDPGNTGYGDDQIKVEGERLIKYFLAALTVPEKDLWVNLSPYEKDRIIPTAFGQTEMGRDLLAQDYILKQISASMIYPEKDLGKDFWGRIYQKAKEVYGTDKIPVSTFNKVWIVPDSAVIVETEKSAFVARGHLKVMLEEDYAAINQNRANEILGNNRLKNQDLKKMNNISSGVVREIILPEIEKEVNEGKNFAQLRQIYYSLVLAAWFKNNLKDNLINQVYADQKKIAGVNIDDKNDKEKIYQRYMEAYRQGVFNYIREDVDANTQEMIPRKYFSGGADYTKVASTIDNRPVNNAGDMDLLYKANVVQPENFKPIDPKNDFRVLQTGLERFKGVGAANNDRFRDAAMLSDNHPLSQAGDRLQGLERLLSNPQTANSQNFTQAVDIIKAIRANPESRPADIDSANRIIAATPIEVLKANGFTEADNQNAFEATTNQLKSANPQTRLQAALTLSSTGDNSDQVRSIISEPISSPTTGNAASRELAQPKAVELVTFDNNRSISTDTTQASKPQIQAAVNAVLPQIPEAQRSAITNVQTAPEGIELPSPVMLTDNGKTLVISAKAVNNPSLINAAPVTASRNELAKAPTSKAQQPEIVSLESVFVQLPESKQVEALQGTVIQALNSNDVVERDTAQRIVAAAPREVAVKAGLSEGLIASAVTATQVQMEKPETALPAAYALKTSGTEGEPLAKANQIIGQKFAALKDLGGIDFNPATLKMEVIKENGGIKVKFDAKLIEEIRANGVEGFIPVIFNIQPLNNAIPLLTENSVKEQTIQLTSL